MQHFFNGVGSAVLFCGLFLMVLGERVKDDRIYKVGLTGVLAVIGCKIIFN